jgi:hypothetical protein
MIMSLRSRRKLRNLSKLYEGMEEKASEPDVCPNAGKRRFTPDKARYCLATKYYGTYTTFRLKPFFKLSTFQDLAQQGSTAISGRFENV